MATEPTTTLSHIRGGHGNAKTAVVFVHGWGCQASDCKLLFDVLKQESVDFQYLAVDLPGHGSPKIICPQPTVSNFAESVIQTVTQLGLQDVYLAGHSMGCRIILGAWQQANKAQTPSIKGLIFLDGSSYKLRPPKYTSEKNLSQMEKSMRRIKLFQSMLSDTTPEDFEMDFLQHLGSLDKAYIDALSESYIDFDHNCMNDVLAEFGKTGQPFLNLQSTDINDSNERVQLKAGESSTWIELIQEKVPQAEQHVVTHSGHFPHVDQPAKSAELLVGFIARYSSS